MSSAPIGAATFSNRARTGADPNLALAWKIADRDGGRNASDQPEDHDRPSVNNDHTSSYDPCEYKAIAIAK